MKINVLKKIAIIIFLLFWNLTFSQTSLPLASPDASITIDGGVSIGQTDYITKKLGPFLRVGGEYFFYSSDPNLLSVGLNFAHQQITGEDSRISVSTKDGDRIIPTTFSTRIISPGFYFNYRFLFSERFSTYLRLAGTFNLFNPKDDTGEDAFGNQSELYKKNYFTFAPELGLKYRISDDIDVSLGVSYNFPSTDYLDDIAASLQKDSYSNIFIGISYSFTSISDSDKDGILDDVDLCKDQPEDFDGFEDEDGCPDLDNDKDGILDVDDKCPDLPETINNYQDEDGCPDVDPNEEILEILLPGDDTFLSNSSTFNSKIYSELNKVIEILNRDPGSIWRIEGHMDNQGDVLEIKKLSNKRSRAIYEYLINNGIEFSRLKVYGLADKFPVAKNDTPEGRKINRRIMIIKEAYLPIQKQIQIKDKDNDGIPDDLDQCPEEPETINNFEDDDGCPDVAENELPQFNQFLLRVDDTFVANTLELNSVAELLLTEIALYIKELPESKWEIESHTDDYGSSADLESLSSNQAKVVFDYLVSLGLPSAQFQFEGFGGSSPITNNSTDEGRRTNRRIVIIRKD